MSYAVETTSLNFQEMSRDSSCEYAKILAHILESTCSFLLILTRSHLEVSVARKYYTHV
jgi:hypothetical protein